MTKSDLSHAMDELQARLNPMLREVGFRKNGRTYNRVTTDGLIHVIGFQMGAFDPPGTTYIPGLRENLYGRFTVNLGVYVPEVATKLSRAAKSTVHDYNCCIRSRLGRTEKTEVWWKIESNETVSADLFEMLRNDAFPFFWRFESRDQILSEFLGATDNTPIMAVPRIVCAIILLEKGEREEARRLLKAQAEGSTRNPGHPAYVRALAERLDISIVS